MRVQSRSANLPQTYAGAHESFEQSQNGKDEQGQMSSSLLHAVQLKDATALRKTKMPRPIPGIVLMLRNAQ